MIPTIQMSVTNLFTWKTMAITTLKAKEIGTSSLKKSIFLVAFFNTRWNKANDYFSCVRDSKKVWNQRRKERKIAAHQPMSSINFFEGLMNFCIAF